MGTGGPLRNGAEVDDSCAKVGHVRQSRNGASQSAFGAKRIQPKLI